MVYNGKGTKDDAKYFESHRVWVHLNAKDEEKFNFLRNLNIFVTSSFWEGFNLPLMKPASGNWNALDMEHIPEVTPFVMSNLNEMVYFIRECNKNVSSQENILNLHIILLGTNFAGKRQH